MLAYCCGYWLLPIDITVFSCLNGQWIWLSDIVLACWLGFVGYLYTKLLSAGIAVSFDLSV